MVTTFQEIVTSPYLFYRLMDGQYGKPKISEIQRHLSASVLAELEIDWAMLNG
jgi:hypothetical protein